MVFVRYCISRDRHNIWGVVLTHIYITELVTSNYRINDSGKDSRGEKEGWQEVGQEMQRAPLRR